MGYRKDMIVYQIYPRSFKDTTGNGVGDIRGIIEGLDHLANLGINTVWLSPIYVSPNDDNGYDIAANPANEAQIIANMPESAIWIMKISMMILPLICILVGFFLYIKKFKIDEETYANILSDLKAREEAGNQETQATVEETAEIETK